LDYPGGDRPVQGVGRSDDFPLALPLTLMSIASRQCSSGKVRAIGMLNLPAAAASGYAHRCDPAAFVVGPTGLALDREHEVLYVASTADNAIFAVDDATDTHRDEDLVRATLGKPDVPVGTEGDPLRGRLRRGKRVHRDRPRSRDLTDELAVTSATHAPPAYTPRMTKKLDFAKVPTRVGSAYPSPFDVPCRERSRQRLGFAAGLTQFGVNRCTLPPGAWSSQRHWHVNEDEFVYVLEGEVVLVTDAGEEILRAGDAAGFKAGEADGHHFLNRSQREAVLLEVGSCFPGGDTADYSDIDMRVLPTGFVKKDGTPY
jgi:uncharacterized cupin superfamily protein